MAEPSEDLWFRIKAWIQDNSWVDIMPAFLVCFLSVHLTLQHSNDLSAFYAGLSALAGILMSSITFTIMLAYGSNSSLMQAARKKYHDNFVHNWVSMIGFSLLSALLPLISILIGPSMKLSQALGALSMTLVIEEAMRCIFWVRFTLLMDSCSPEQNTDGFGQEAALNSVNNYGQRK